MENPVRSWLEHLYNALQAAEWETAGDCYVVKGLKVPFDTIEKIKEALDATDPA